MDTYGLSNEEKSDFRSGNYVKKCTALLVEFGMCQKDENYVIEVILLWHIKKTWHEIIQNEIGTELHSDKWHVFKTLGD